jgi:hypothetical protein
MGSPDVLFKGIPNQFVRKYTRDAIVRLRPEVVVIPCAGAFASAIAAVDAGQPPERIVCGDIALYTSAIGYWLAGTDWRLERTGRSRGCGRYLSRCRLTRTMRTAGTRRS